MRMYKWRLDPSEFRPQGSVGFSRIDTELLKLELETIDQRRRREEKARRCLERDSATKIVAAAKGWLYRRHVLWNLDTDVGLRYMEARIARDMSADHCPNTTLRNAAG